MIAALVGIVMATIFGLSAAELTAGARELARAEVLEARVNADRSITQLLTDAVPRNIFSDFSEDSPTSIISVAVFGMIFGIAALLVSEENADQGKRIRSFVDTTQAVIMKLVKLVINLTPYGVLALMTRVIATTDGGVCGAAASLFVCAAISFFILGFSCCFLLARIDWY